MNTAVRILIAEFLESEHDRFNRPSFIEDDPISIPHRYSRKEDREIAGFLTAVISWGQRGTILKNATTLMMLMEDAPHEFIRDCGKVDLARFEKFVHRTFNGVDCVFFVRCLMDVYRIKGGLHSSFKSALNHSGNNLGTALHLFRKDFFGNRLPGRSSKHFSDPLSNSAAKRLCMYLRWMVRRDDRGVDFGIWNDVSPSVLHCPLDVHSGRVARELGLLGRNQNDWTAVIELTRSLQEFDPNDPCRFDFSLFGGGVSERNSVN
jgi:uncharacterized protein (TIGR02757 family)